MTLLEDHSETSDLVRGSIAERRAVESSGLRVANANVSVIFENQVEVDGIYHLRSLLVTSFEWKGGDSGDSSGSMTDEHLTSIARVADGSLQVLADRIAETVPESNDDPVDVGLLGEPAATQPDSIGESLPPKTPGHGSSGMEALNYANMANYAQYYSYGNRRNSDYPNLPNNCANFASQTLQAGDWKSRGGVNPKDLKNWSPNLTGPAGSSYTWGGAKYLFHFVHNVGSKSYLDNIWNSRRGDLLFTDWDPNKKPDGSIDHTMVVSARTTQPHISQHSPHRNNIPLSQTIARIKQDRRTVNWYGLVT